MGAGCVCATLRGMLRVPERGQSRAQGPELGVRPAPRCLALLLGDSWFLPTLLPTCPCLLAQSYGSIDVAVPSRRALQQPRAMGQLRERQPSLSSLSSRCAGIRSECPALLLQGFTVHTSICLPPPFPLFPSLFFCRMLQGKENLWKRFQELFSLPWC